MATHRLRFMLKILFVDTLESRIMPLPANTEILQLIGARREPLFVIFNNGQIRPAVVYITLVNENNISFA